MTVKCGSGAPARVRVSRSCRGWRSVRRSRPRASRRFARAGRSPQSNCRARCCRTTRDRSRMPDGGSPQRSRCSDLSARSWSRWIWQRRWRRSRRATSSRRRRSSSAKTPHRPGQQHPSPASLAACSDGTHLTRLFAHLRDLEILEPGDRMRPARSGSAYLEPEERHETFVAWAADPLAYARLWKLCAAAIGGIRNPAGVPAALRCATVRGASGCCWRRSRIARRTRRPFRPRVRGPASGATMQTSRTAGCICAAPGSRAEDGRCSYSSPRRVRRHRCPA